eukprot:maker-scaffold_141-snap-gene-0.14-mRNA-1 protein AED:0.47 eAED:0.82 QI:0/0/0/1/0/0/5/0/158
MRLSLHQIWRDVRRTFNYELFNCNNFNIRYWSWNYRGCWHQTCPPILIPITKPKGPVLLFSVTTSPYQDWVIYAPAAFLGCAVSQAPSPESNPNSPLPVKAMTDIMSHSQLQNRTYELTLAWLNLLNKRMTTGRINQISMKSKILLLGFILDLEAFSP